MEIRTLWVRRRDDSTELLEAWDEYAIDENPDGAEAAFENAKARVGSDAEEFRYIVLVVPFALIEDAFDPKIISLGSET